MTKKVVDRQPSLCESAWCQQGADEKETTMGKATGNKDERTTLTNVIERFGGLSRERVEGELVRVKGHLQSGYKGNLGTVMTRVERAPHMTDRYYAELLCGRFLERIGQHGFTLDQVLDALALES